MTQAPDAVTADQALAIASALIAQKRTAEAERIYRGVLVLDPGHVDSLHAVGRLCLQRGAAQDALAPFTRALSLKPDSAEIENDLGTALAALGRQAEAAPHFARAIALQTDFATAHNNLGNALAALDRTNDAIGCFERALALRPDFASAEFNLAGALATLDSHARAIEHFQRALKLKPQFADAHRGLGTSLHSLNRPREALAEFERAVALDPHSAAAGHGLGLAKQTLGRLDEARSDFEKAVTLAPTEPAYHRALAEAKHFEPGDTQLAAMEQLAATALSEKQQSELHFAKAKAYGDLGRHEDAARHLLAGNALKRKRVEYDEAATFAMWRHIETVFTAELLRRRAGVGDPSDVPVFILGMPRSGSTLVEQVLASHPRVFGAGELGYLANAAKHFKGRSVRDYFPEIAATMSNEQLRGFGADYVAHIRTLAPDATRITDKMPANFRFIGLIKLVLPNARIIHTRRDPVDTCLSCFSKLFTGAQNFTYDLGELGRYYRAYERLMAHWRIVLPPGAMLEVQYEDLVGDFEAEGRRIVGYCGLDWDEKLLAFHQNMRPVRTASVTQVRQPIYRNAIGRWKSYEMMLQPLLNELGTAKI